MARGKHLLTFKEVASVKDPGRYADGDGLYLLVRQRSETLEKLWTFRYRRGGRGSAKETTLSLGRVSDVSLSEAREKASACRQAIAAGLDPKGALVKVADGKTFREVAASVLKNVDASSKNDKHKAQWKMTLGEAYCRNLLGKPVALITTEDILSVLSPVWLQKPETAYRLRGRIEKVLDYAKAHGMRSGPNPAVWRGHLKLLLPKQKKLTRGHHAALPWRQAPSFIVRIRDLGSVSAAALEWTILTACRTQESAKAERSEVDRASGVWTIPAKRMKAGKEHRVPLSDRCLEIFDATEDLGSAWLFPARSIKKHISLSAMAECLKHLNPDVTVHGFRSTFRDWAGDATSYADSLIETALAHTIENKAEAAYRRGDALERRRELMQAWCNYLDQSSNVIAIRRV